MKTIYIQKEAITAEQGNYIRKKHLNFDLNQYYIIYLKETKILTTAFVRNLIAKLYKKYTVDFLKKHIKYYYRNDAQKIMIKRAIEIELLSKEEFKKLRNITKKILEE